MSVIDQSAQNWVGLPAYPNLALSSMAYGSQGGVKIKDLAIMLCLQGGVKPSSRDVFGTNFVKLIHYAPCKIKCFFAFIAKLVITQLGS